MQLFDTIDGNHFTILGMPLLPLLGALRERGLIAGMIRIALTGSIGMGKSTVAKMFERAGVPLFDADAEVRRLQGLAARWSRRSASAFPGAVRDGAVDREALAALVLGEPDKLAALEAIVHPAVHAARDALHRRPSPTRRRLLFDIPLLFETGGEGAFDKVIVVSAPAEVQRERVLAAPGHDRRKSSTSILARQMPDAEKRARADFVIDTSGDLAATEAPGARHSRLPRTRRGWIIARVREIVFDTETTGLNPAGGDRMVEIGCVEIFNRVETGRHFHAYFNPDRDMPSEAEAVHGLTSDLPVGQAALRASKVEELLEFIADSPLVAHNAGFDFGFLNHRARAVRPAGGVH